MSMRTKGVRLVAAVVLIVLGPAEIAASAEPLNPDLNGGTFLLLDSEDGEPILNGIDRLYSTADAQFSVGSAVDNFSAVLFGHDGTFWNVVLGAPSGHALDVGSYSDAVRFPTPTQPRIDVSGGGVGCNTTSGSFTVTEASLIGGIWVTFDATFEQFCEASTTPLRGRVRWEMPPDTTPPSWLFIPTSVTREAPDESGVTFDYALPMATDNVDPNPAVSCDPPPGSQFVIGTTSVQCVASDFSGNQTAGSFDMIVLAPLDLGVVPDTRLRIDPANGQTTAGLRVLCGRDEWVAVNYTLEQVVANRATISGSVADFIFCTAPSVYLSYPISANNGVFKSGKANATASAYSCLYLCWERVVSEDVLLRATR